MRARSRSVRRQAGNRSRLIMAQFGSRSWRIAYFDASRNLVATRSVEHIALARTNQARLRVRTRQRPAGVCDGLDRELRRTSKLSFSRDVTYDAIASTLPNGAARWPMQRDRCQWLHPSRGGGGRPHEGNVG
jgi:hypothetical protein